MCLFPLPNENVNSVSYQKGIRFFDCGACPECLNKRSNIWALRSVYESKMHLNSCMITLTYDSFLYPDKRYNLEKPVNPDIVVDKTHIQKFIKRLRKWISSSNPVGCSERIKYLCCAEYGTRTHRAHYHLLLFGVNFPDKYFYKKSKRKNLIYMSSTLNKLWGYGICTIDCTNIGPAVARYCTKYCAKSRSSDTFMLFSQSIGFDGLMRNFNGFSYFIDGREYPVPRMVWEAYIMRKYSRYRSIVDYKYVNRRKDLYEFASDDLAYCKSCANRKRYRYLRDRDFVYVRYLEYWKRKGSQFEQNRLSPIARIYLLNDGKFHNYKIAALETKRIHYRFCDPASAVAPGSNCTTAYHRYRDKLFSGVCPRFTCPLPPRPNRASDTAQVYFDPFDGSAYRNFDKFDFINSFISKKLLTRGLQLSII
ncbi:replication initiator protein [Sigmofec virus UA08Rod_5614]|uniref:Replication initiator protein n=1 Tax=Sigmofec virus UA08Rod_5614 TaxID=2929431 RepID=A0A976N1D1_9VIRU|nr:replication initiator protein [Sigmofec virus UA08Rod_5614]